MANCGASMFSLWINFFCNTCNGWVIQAICNTYVEHGEEGFQFSNEDRDNPALKFCGRVKFKQVRTSRWKCIFICLCPCSPEFLQRLKILALHFAKLLLDIEDSTLECSLIVGLRTSEV